MMKRSRVLIAAAAVGLLVGAAPFVPSQRLVQSDDILNRQVTNVNLRDTTVDQALLQALIVTGVPGGMAVAQHCGPLPRHTLTPVKPTLRGLLDEIVSAEPGYTWEARGGVINVNSHDGISSFLQTMLPKVEINKAASLRDALNELLKIPEVRRQEQRYLGSRLIQGFAYGFGQAAKPNETEKLSLSATNVTVREALNLIALKGGAVWLLSPTLCKGRAIYSIDFVAK